MWTDASITYHFEGAPRTGLMAKLTLRQDLQETTMPIRLRQQPLP